jgi:hypothetical protein
MTNIQNDFMAYVAMVVLLIMAAMAIGGCAQIPAQDYITLCSQACDGGIDGGAGMQTLILDHGQMRCECRAHVKATK